MSGLDQLRSEIHSSDMLRSEENLSGWVLRAELELVSCAIGGVTYYSGKVIRSSYEQPTNRIRVLSSN
jgi:hypothetical protein